MSYNERNHENLSENISTRPIFSDNSKRKAIADMFDRPFKILHSELNNGDVIQF